MAKADPSTALAPVEDITRNIRALRGQRVILDCDLAAIYGVATGRFNEAVKRNAERFPEDFMFQLTREEAERSRSQIATLNSGRGHNIKYLPHAFTEHGAIHAANVLNSPRAIAMGVHVVRAFVQLRGLLASNKELARRFDQLEARLNKKLAEHDEAIAATLSAIRQLMNPQPPKRHGKVQDLSSRRGHHPQHRDPARSPGTARQRTCQDLRRRDTRAQSGR